MHKENDFPDHLRLSRKQLSCGGVLWPACWSIRVTVESSGVESGGSVKGGGLLT